MRGDPLGMLRLFTAVELPAAVKTVLLSLQTDIPALKWTREDTLHLTLRFIGETAQSKLPAIKAALASVQGASFFLRLNGLGLFERPAQTILWAGLESCPELTALKHGIDAALTVGAGLAPAQGRFSPHITLGRLKGPAPAELRRFAHAHATASMAEFTVTSFTLFRSVLRPDGAVHFQEEVYPLREETGRQGK